MFVDPRLIGAALIALVMLGEGVAIWWYRDEAIDIRVEFDKHLETDREQVLAAIAEKEKNEQAQRAKYAKARSDLADANRRLDADLIWLREYATLLGQSAVQLAGTDACSMPGTTTDTRGTGQPATHGEVARVTIPVSLLEDAFRDYEQCKKLIEIQAR